MSELFVPQVSIAPTRRRRFLWAAWWSGAPTEAPFRKPDAFEGGARTREDAKARAEVVAGMTLNEVAPRWARAWQRVQAGSEPWPRGAHRGHGATGAQAPTGTEGAEPKSIWSILGVTRDVTFEELKVAFRVRALQCHPDQGGSAAAFIQLQHAYQEAQKRIVRPRRTRR